MNWQFDICRFLLDDCALATDTDAMTSALKVLSLAVRPHNRVNRRRPPGITRYGEMFRLFIETYNMDIELGEASVTPSMIPFWWLSCPDTATFSMIMRNQASLDPSVPMFKLSLFDDMGLGAEYMIGSFPRFQSPDVLLAVFGLAWTRESLGAIPIAAKEGILHAASRGAVSFSYYRPHSRRWRLLARDLVRWGTNPSCVSAGETPLTIMCYFPARCIGETGPYCWAELHRGLREWILLLMDSGVDVVSYGQNESQTWEDNGMRNKLNMLIWDWKGYPRVKCTVDRLIYGACLEDWGFMLRQVRTLSIFKRSSAPGAWPQDPRLPDCIVHNPDFHEVGWVKIRSISVASAPFDSRVNDIRSSNELTSVAHLIAAQDDAGPLVLSQLWRRRPWKLCKRRSSQPPPSPQPIAADELRGTHMRFWLPWFHMEDISSVDDPYRHLCRCRAGIWPEGCEFKPSWFRRFCFDCTDLQDTEEWMVLSFLGDLPDNDLHRLLDRCYRPVVSEEGGGDAWSSHTWTRSHTWSDWYVRVHS